MAELLARIALLSAMIGAVLTAWWAWRARDRWGRVSRPAALVGVGPYRRALVRSHAPRPVPLSVVLVAGTGCVWGFLTTLVFAPSGLVFLLAPARHDPVRQILLTLSGLGVFATAVAAFALGPSLVRASRALLEREPDADERALSVATWSSLHHAMVLLSFVLFAVHEDDARIVAIVAVPCAIGLVHAWSLGRVSRIVARVQRCERDDEDASSESAAILAIGDRSPL
ncbi:hypothetical protein [Sandaracinus amylolyticus]|uniref:hypothetical protein n=1 Tax=Sandaracinus amylolyticus TaxID=927083 RepID=UPI001F481E7E|nr:hypothetical protein [Sandaracinus amylolyticus]UJR84815.1 Hypothetical protein I5071_68940 [Sandaracinus amylolyticus]